MFGKVAQYGCVTIIFVTITALLAILFLLPLYGRPLAWWMPVAFAVSMLLLIGVTRSYFRAGVSIAELEARGLVETQDYQAIRAFGVEEWEDEGSHYLLELEDRSVLYLNGQYLYEFEPIEDDPELNQPRRFPCTEFTLKRHRKKGHVLELLCNGMVIEPESIFPPFDRQEYNQRLIPEDGQIIRNRSYDQIKAERLARS